MRRYGSSERVREREGRALLLSQQIGSPRDSDGVVEWVAVLACCRSEQVAVYLYSGVVEVCDRRKCWKAEASRRVPSGLGLHYCSLSSSKATS